MNLPPTLVLTGQYPLFYWTPTRITYVQAAYNDYSRVLTGKTHTGEVKLGIACCSSVPGRAATALGK